MKTKKLFRFGWTLCLSLWLSLAVHAQIHYEQAFGELFEQVQLQHLFPDSKTFTDTKPKYSVKKIMKKYEKAKKRSNFDLKKFVAENFEMPESKGSDYKSDGKTITEHINALWTVLKRNPDDKGGALMPLPNSYIVPGGRFREIYYWDSYFTMLGLSVSKEHEIMENMVDNFAYLIDEVGHIPNGNRSYFFSRSQPPFFALMVSELAKVKGEEETWKKYRPQLEKEYRFWMRDQENLTQEKNAMSRVVMMEDGSVLNRYWDDQATPRPESYREDVELAEEMKREEMQLYRDLRAACESGWDFSSRWFRDGKTLGSIHTTEIIPVDLNCLLYYLESAIATAYGHEGDQYKVKMYQTKANARKEAIKKYCWDSEVNFFTDYDFVAKSLKKSYSAAGLFPLFFNVATGEQAKGVAAKTEKDFLKPAGILTTLEDSGQQWDAPNGWAPLQWIAYQGLANYDQGQLAEKIKKNWMENNERVYKNTGKMVEKYNVLDTSLGAGGGEYPLQDGFGWSNGVYLKFTSVSTTKE